MEEGFSLGQQQEGRGPSMWATRRRRMGRQREARWISSNYLRHPLQWALFIDLKSLSFHEINLNQIQITRI